MPDGLTFSSIQDIRRHNEEAYAQQSNARARAEGWYHTNWESVASYQHSGHACGNRRIPTSARESIWRLIGDDWQPVSTIIAARQAEKPGHSAAAIRSHCRSLEHAGRVESRIVELGGGKWRKEYRVAKQKH